MKRSAYTVKAGQGDEQPAVVSDADARTGVTVSDVHAIPRRPQGSGDRARIEYHGIGLERPPRRRASGGCGDVTTPDPPQRPRRILGKRCGQGSGLWRQPPTSADDDPPPWHRGGELPCIYREDGSARCPSKRPRGSPPLPKCSVELEPKARRIDVRHDEARAPGFPRSLQLQLSPPQSCGAGLPPHRPGERRVGESRGRRRRRPERAPGARGVAVRKGRRWQWGALRTGRTPHEHQRGEKRRATTDHSARLTFSRSGWRFFTASISASPNFPLPLPSRRIMIESARSFSWP